MVANESSSQRSKTGAFVGLAAIGVVALLGYFVMVGKIAGGKPVCDVCKRIIHTETAFRIVRTNGSVKATCCPRCGLTAIIQNGGAALEAVDYTSRKPIHAAGATYLEGSDIMECCTSTGYRADEGAYQDVEYDRCMPSLLAFARREDADIVRQKHGGRIITFEEARQSVVRQLKDH